MVIINSVEEHKLKNELISVLGLEVKGIANIGCDIGYETIARLWNLRAEKTMGIDCGGS